MSFFVLFFLRVKILQGYNPLKICHFSWTHYSEPVPISIMPYTWGETARQTVFCLTRPGIAYLNEHRTHGLPH